MKFVHPLKSAFMKATGHPLFQRLNDNAGMVCGVLFSVNDLYLTSRNFIERGSLKISFPPANADEWLTAAGLIFIGTSAAFMSVDKYKWMKKPIGVAVTLAGTFMTVAGNTMGPGMYAASIAPIITGLSMIFEDKANSMVSTDDENSGLISKLKNFYFKYPVLSMSFVQTGSAASSLAQAVSNGDKGLGLFSVAWMVANTVFALTDNNLSAKIRANARPQNMEPVSP